MHPLLPAPEYTQTGFAQKAHSSTIVHCKEHPSGLLVTQSSEARLAVWDPNGWMLVTNTKTKPHPLLSADLLFLGNGNIVTQYGRSIEVRNPHTLERIHALEGHNDLVPGFLMLDNEQIVTYFKQFPSNGPMDSIKVSIDLTSHVVVYLGRLGLLLNVPFNRRQTTGCSPNVPVLVGMSVDKALRAVFIAEYLTPVS